MMYDRSDTTFRGAGAAEPPPLRRHIDVLRSKWWVVLVSVLVTTAAAAYYVRAAEKRYEATTDVLVTAVPSSSDVFIGLGLIRQAADPTRDVTTAARFIDNIDVARRVASALRSTSSPQQLLQQVSVQPIAQSNVVAVTAQSPSPRAAQDLANAFADEAIERRTVTLHLQVEPKIDALRRRLRRIARAGGDSQPLTAALATLESLRAGPDPTLQRQTAAALPTAAVSPRPKLALAGGLIAGLLLGIIAAFALSVLDTREARENRLQALGLSVLARVPRLGRGHKSRHAFDEAFRYVRAMIRFASPDRPIRTVAVTSATEKEGKTTTSFQLAMAALEAGQKVLLVEADPYRPSLWQLVDVGTPQASGGEGPGLFDYLLGDAELEDIVRPTAVPGLSFVAAGRTSQGSITGLLERERGRAMIDALATFADFVILDCPPVGPRADAVLIAAGADGVIIVIDLEKTNERAIDETVRKLRSGHVPLLGVVINRDSEASGERYHYDDPERGGAGVTTGAPTRRRPYRARLLSGARD